MSRSDAWAFGAGLILFTAGCGGASKAPEDASANGQSYAQAIALMCDVDKLGNIEPGDDLLGVGKKRSDWLEGRLENPEGIYFRTLISVKTAEEQAGALRDEAKKSGLAGCALSEALLRDGMGGFVP